MNRARAYIWIRNTLAILACVALVTAAGAFALRRAHDLSLKEQCVQNLKRLGEACEMYQADWHGVLVPYGAPFAWGPAGSLWMELLEPYLRRMEGPSSSGMNGVNIGKMFMCPSRPSECWCVRRTYGMNDRCGGWDPGKEPVVISLKKVRYPRATVRIAEVDWELCNGSLLAGVPSQYRANDRESLEFPECHLGKGNVLWIDGHVSSMTREQYNMRDDGPDDGNIWLRLEGPKPPLL